MKELKVKTFVVGDGFIVTENESRAILRQIFSKYS